MDAIDGGAPIAPPAQAYGISARSLRDYLLGKTLTQKRGREGVLTTTDPLCEHFHIFNMHLICKVSNACSLRDMLVWVDSPLIMLC